MFHSNMLVGELAAFGAALSWTLAAIVYTSVGKRIGALATSFFRIAIACFLMVCYGRAISGDWLPAEATCKTWLVFGVSGFFWFFLSDLCLLKAYVLVGPRLPLLVMSLTPPLAAMLSWICVGDGLAVWRWAAMTFTLTGVAWVIIERPEAVHDTSDRQHRGRGLAFAMLAAILQAVAFVLSKVGIDECSASTAAIISIIGAMLGHLALVTVWRRWPAMFAALRQKRALVAIVGAATVGPFIGVLFSMAALDFAPTGVVATTIATMPVLILPFSVFLYREHIGTRAIVGALIAIAGIAMLSLPY